jgi:hypothetical protein
MNEPEENRSDKPGVFARLNPHASARSVVYKALIWAVVFPLLYGVVVLFREEPTSYLAFKMTLCAVLGAFVGAICEWQVAPDFNE